MKQKVFPGLVSFALFLTGLSASLAGAGVRFDAVKFNDLASGVSARLQWSWHAIGVDPDDNVYVVFGGPDGDSADCALFQYRARTGERRLVGTLSAAAKAAGTWRAGERMEKGHTHLPWVNGKLYIGTMGFHDASAASPSQMRLAENSHGAHLMAYDPKAGRLEDLSRSQPDGVFFPQRGFMCLSPISDEGLVVGLTVPHGDLLLWDAVGANTRAVVPGVKEEFGRHVTREVIPAPNGRIYYMYSGQQLGRDPGHMYWYDMKTGERSPPVTIASDYWNGSVRTKSGQIYVMTDPGDVYQLHPETNSVERIGRLFPDADWHEVVDGEHLYQKPHALGMVLSTDEKSIYSIPLRKRILKTGAGAREEGEAQPRGPQVPFGLYRFDLATRTSTRIADVPPEIGYGYITGTNIKDSRGDVYFAHHGGAFLGLVKVNLGN